MSKYIVETNQLSKHFGNKISVNHIDLKVPKGEIYGFLGPNGAGKTTTIRMILGLMRPTKGKIRLFGEDAKNRQDLLRRVGSLVESPSYYDHLSGYENLKVITTYLGISEKRIDEVLEWVRLKENAYEKVKNYSLGMKQRLGIASALLGNPDLLILDEPTNGLDPAGIQEIREMIRQLPQQIGATVIVSSHLLSEVEQIATCVGIINKGQLIFQDSLAVLQERSRPRLELEVEHPEQANRFLIQQGWATYTEKQKVFCNQVNKQETAAIVEALVLGKFPVYRVVENKKTLEEIFLELTGKENSL